MVLSYTWEVTSVKTQDQLGQDGQILKDAVVQTYWKCTGTDSDGNSGTFSGATPFTAESNDLSTFTSFEDLTEETVLHWIADVVTGDYLDHVESQIKKQIQEAIIQERDLPWATAEEASE